MPKRFVVQNNPFGIFFFDYAEALWRGICSNEVDFDTISLNF